MALGFSAAVANAILDCYFNATNITAPTTAPATETTRKAISSAVASGGAVTSDAALTWTNVAGSEDYTHFSVWTDITAGSFVLSGTVTANAVTAGDTFTIAVGDFDVSLSTAA